jgi:streptogramin lyase
VLIAAALRAIRRLGFLGALALFGGSAARASAQSITEFPLPSADIVPGYIIPGPDGNLWFTANERVGRITPAGAITIVFGPAGVPGPGHFDAILGIVSGPDGNLWFNRSNGERAFLLGTAIGRITPEGVATYFELTERRPPNQIAAGADGNLWFTEFAPDSNLIRQITTDGVVTDFSVPAHPFDITAGRDGNLWFTLSNTIGRMTTAGAITEFSIPTASAGPGAITAGPDGNLWFLETASNKIGRITTSGVVTEFAIPTPASGLFGITAGPDGNIWFTEQIGNKIGRLILDRALALDVRILPVVGSTPGANGTFFRTSVQLHNPGSTTMAGRIAFHRSGVSGGDSDPALSYSLSPWQTQSIGDLLSAIGSFGLGSADIEVTSGSAPVATARVFNDAGSAGTTGFTEEALRPQDALTAGQRGVLIVPSDFAAYRLNVGIRTLPSGALAMFTVRDPAGVVLSSGTRVFPATYHEQQGATAFLQVPEIAPGGSITIAVNAGAAIFYGATVDNRTGDPSLQIERATP